MVFGGDDARTGSVPSGGHDDVMKHFSCWEGDVEPGWSVNFLGVHTRVAFFSMFEQLADFSQRRHLLTTHPYPNEDYFEWVALLQSVVEAQQRFTMVELGAGYGKWLVNGALAVRGYSGIPCRLIGVEAEPAHFKWMLQHLSDNGISRSEAKLRRAAVVAEDGPVWFHVGEAADWYGQAVADATDAPQSAAARFRSRLGAIRSAGRRRVQRVPGLSLASVLANEDRVDFLDVDVQGVEADVLVPAALELDDKVRRAYIGTHSRDNEERIRALFSGLGWECIDDYPSNQTCDTRIGQIAFQDGVQTWLNRRLSR
jgi:FkbM family methyltransferase